MGYLKLDLDFFTYLSALINLYGLVVTICRHV